MLGYLSQNPFSDQNAQTFSGIKINYVLILASRRSAHVVDLYMQFAYKLFSAEDLPHSGGADIDQGYSCIYVHVPIWLRRCILVA